MSQETPELPNLAEVIGPLLQRLPAEKQPLLIALAERMAAERYRRWAGEATDAGRRSLLLACAEREEQIAARVESLYANAEAERRELLASHPELVETNRAIFAGRPLAQQFAIQAQGERLGAATWRAFAQQTADERRRGVFIGCAALEEDSAVVLEAFLAETRLTTR